MPKIGNNMATITLREKTLRDGRKSLYLDIYENGRRRYEFLKLYILPDKSDAIKAQNRANYRLADIVRGKRMVEAQNAAFGFANRHDKALLLPTFEKFRKGRNSNTYISIATHLRRECAPTMQVAQVDERWVAQFVDNLRTRGISDNSISEYISLFRVYWRWCVKKGIGTGNPFEGVQLRTHQAKREYLTAEELQKLANTPSKVRDIFLFSCFTGLRWSDVSQLTWGDVEQFRERVRIRYRQKKTGQFEYQDLSAQAVALLGERGADEERIFSVGNLATANSHLKRWCKSAGITKHITFHCSRHTFATLLIAEGVDLFVVSKLLGHADIKTTQIYAKMVDKRKQEAVDRLPQVL